MSIVDRKTFHARKKAEWDEKWLDDPKSHYSSLMVKGKRDQIKGRLLFLLDL